MKQIILFSLIFLSSLFIFSCSKNECREMYKEECGCLDEYTPVCGCNEKTYANSCYAECAGVEFTAGKCP